SLYPVHLHSFPTRRSSDLTGVVAAAFASASWVFLFHGIFGRMYSLFLFTSLLSFLALLARRYVLWGIALLLVLASHPYAVLVVRSEEHTSELQSLAYLVCR